MTRTPSLDAKQYPDSKHNVIQARESLGRFISDDAFPCVAAKAANAQDNIQLLVARSITEPKDDVAIYEALSRFGAQSADADLSAGYRTLAVVFEGPGDLLEEEFETALWNRLQNLHNFDAVRGQPWDERVDDEPDSPHFSMSIARHAFFVVGLHPAASPLEIQEKPDLEQ